MDHLITDFISRMGLALPVAILVAVRAGQMLHLMDSMNIETKVTDVTMNVIKEKIVEQLSIIFRVYRDTTPDGNVNLPAEVNLQELSEHLFFRDESFQCLNEIYLDLVNQGTQSPHFAQALALVLSL